MHKQIKNKSQNINKQTHIIETNNNKRHKGLLLPAARLARLPRALPPPGSHRGRSDLCLPFCCSFISLVVFFVLPF